MFKRDGEVFAADAAQRNLPNNRAGKKRRPAPAAIHLATWLRFADAMVSADRVNCESRSSLRNDARKSDAVGKRSSGSFSISRRMVRSSSGETPGLISRGGGGTRCRMASKMAPSVGPSKGRAPVANS